LGSGRRRLLATEATLNLLGLDPSNTHALVAVPGRPFSLGGLRLEVFPSGLMPGAASLLCEREGRRIVYAGPVGVGAGAELRAADAVCVDAGGARTGVDFPALEAGLQSVGRAIREVLAGGAAPVILLPSAALGLTVAASLAADRIAVRAHRTIVLAAAAYQRAGLPAPTLSRFAGRLGPGEVLLWPAYEKVPPRRQGGRGLGLVTVGPEPLVGRSDGLPAERVVPLSLTADFQGLLRYVEATSAKEVAVLGDSGEDLTTALRSRGLDAYRLGPPRQAELFAA
jgi:hypothetical protein